jgi:DNA-binding winged helix-turn-helix (wHTH) protein/predicted ATPase
MRVSAAGAGDRPAVRLEPENERAWVGERQLDLTPKAFAILRHFVEHPARLVTKDDLLAAVWGDTVVSEAALTSCIRDLRRALDDTSRAPRYIETVHRRGFRFIGPVGPSRRIETTRSADVERSAPVVGRDAEMARLHALFDEAAGGRRRLVFVTGEAGIGKTTLVESFLSGLDAGDGLRTGRGQCVEHYGTGEAYLPVLEALARLAREPRGDTIVRALRQYAPTWLAQLPALLTDDDLEAVQRRAQGTTRDRMLRELGEALDVVAAEEPLVLVLEDLHWSDSATVDLLAMLARRREAARILIVGTYRPAEVAAGSHPLKPVKQELQLHGDCEEVVLDFLNEPAVEHYLAGRFPSASFEAGLTRFLHRNTSGNPLFLVNVVDHLIARGHVRHVDERWELSVPIDDVASDVPDTLWQLVDRQIERLGPDEQAVLAVASVAGAEFSAAVATADGIDVDAAEASCAALARRGQFLRAMGAAEWPDGTIAGRYGFIHALYRNVLYERVSIGQRVGLHLRIGARLERAHGRHAAEIAGELAMHFEQGRDFERAVRYRQQAADNGLRHNGHREAASHATRALELLQTIPESPERLQQELALHTMLGAALVARGWAAPEVARTYARAHELCGKAGVTPEIFPVIGGLFGFYVTRAELGTSRDLAHELSTLATATSDPAILLGAHNAEGMVSFYSGELAAALVHLERGLAVYDPHEHNPSRSPAFWGGHDTGVSCAVHAAWCLWLLGHAERGAARMRQALDWARAAEHPFTLAFVCHFAASFSECRRDVDAARTFADEAIRHSTENGFELFASLASVHRGWLAGDAAEIRSGVTAYRDTGSRFGMPTYLGLLAEAYAEGNRLDESAATVTEALAVSDATGAHYWDAELRRLQGSLALRRATPGRKTASGPSDAEACFRSAIEIARRQEAKTLELRAATSLSRLWQSQGKIADARALLSGVYGWFGEGFDTADLRDAKALLDELDGGTRRRR